MCGGKIVLCVIRQGDGAEGIPLSFPSASLPTVLCLACPTRPADVLARFEQDMAYLAATELHPSLRGEGSTHLVHLVPAGALREAAAACMRGHQHFAGKVAELEGLFGGLKADVEALFMQVGGWVDKRVVGGWLAGWCAWEGGWDGGVGGRGRRWGRLCWQGFGTHTCALGCGFHCTVLCVCVYGPALPQAPSVDLQALTQHLEETHLQVDEQVGRAGGKGAGGMQRDDQDRQPAVGVLCCRPCVCPPCRSCLIAAAHARPCDTHFCLATTTVAPAPLPTLQASIVAALSSDLSKVQQLVEQASEQLGADPSASVQVGAWPGWAVVNLPAWQQTICRPCVPACLPACLPASNARVQLLRFPGRLVAPLCRPCTGV